MASYVLQTPPRAAHAKPPESKERDRKLVITMASYALQTPPRVAHVKPPKTKQWSLLTDPVIHYGNTLALFVTLLKSNLLSCRISKHNYKCWHIVSIIDNAPLDLESPLGPACFEPTSRILWLYLQLSPRKTYLAKSHQKFQSPSSPKLQDKIIFDKWLAFKKYLHSNMDRFGHYQ